MSRVAGAWSRLSKIAPGLEPRAAVASAWSLILRVAGLACTFLLGVVLARGLGPAEFGVYGLVTTVAALVMTATLVGTPQLAVRDFSILSNKEDWEEVWRRLAQFGLTTTVIAALLGLIATALVGLLGASTTSVLLTAQGGILALLMGVTALSGAVLRGLGAMVKGQAMDNLVRPASVFVLVLLFFAIGRSISAVDALWLQVLVTIVASGVSMTWIARSIPTAWPGVGDLANLTRFDWLRTSVPLGAVDVLRQFSSAYSVILVGWIASAADLGIFRVAVSCGTLVSMPVTIFHVVLAPTIAQLHEDRRPTELQHLLSSATRAMTAIVLPMTVGIWFFGRSAISLAFGSQYASAWLPLFFICCSQLVSAAFGMGPILLAMCGGERRLTIIYVVAVLGGMLLTFPLTHRWGSPGAAAASIFTALLIGLGSRQYGRAKLGVDVSSLRFSRQISSQ